MTPVQEIMSSDVLSIAPTASVLEALRMMSGADVRHLPVVDDGRLVGIISDRDIHRFEGADGVSDNVVMRHLTAPVSASMSTALHTVTPTTSLDEAAQAMIDALPGDLVACVARAAGRIAITRRDALEQIAQGAG